MKKIILVIFFTFLLTGCANKQVSQSNPANDFQNKKECASLTREIENKIHEKYVKDTERTAQLEEIFYSKKNNSCLYKMSASVLINNVYFKSYQLIDALTEKIIATTDGCLPAETCGKTWTEAENYINEQIKNNE